eukprot:Plantae.Rhodophyta-Hildenbrandia_rubra.ctg13971.p1 GENE.Plantae.Rhodophyta-Hildenbrandia_rubra.ctg13971~~Plantae.Rhodophyta-Hildenbrandia_rubra.ctg13971.p1  ORF type:complete len:262 (-),score=25.25 Plantae.Rhodophyta-Hildenbrandia_rubra.ctg13971:1728-2513(-)
MFATYHIRAMTAIRRDFQALFEAVGMVENAGPFVGHTFEAYVHMVIETGCEGVMTDAVLFSSGAPDSLKVWKNNTKFSQIGSFRNKLEFDGLLTSAPNSYWKASKPNFTGIDGVILSEDADKVYVHFLQITTSKAGNEHKVRSASLQDYAKRLIKGWGGDENNLFICLWLVLPAALYDEESGKYTKEQKLEMSVKTDEGELAHRSKPEGSKINGAMTNKPILQGKVRFDWNVVKRRIPVQVMTESWWAQNREDFPRLLAEY